MEEPGEDPLNKDNNSGEEIINKLEDINKEIDNIINDIDETNDQDSGKTFYMEDDDAENSISAYEEVDLSERRRQ